MGKFFKLNPNNGSIICKNELSGKGYNFMVKKCSEKLKKIKKNLKKN